MTSFRFAARLPAAMKIGVRIGDALEREAGLENVGREGARVRMRNAPGPGSIVRLRLDTATAWEPLLLDAVVRWTTEPDPAGLAAFGVEFAPLAPEAALALVRWLATLPERVPARSRA